MNHHLTLVPYRAMLCIALVFALALGSASFLQAQTSSETVSAATEQAKQTIDEAGQAATTKVEQLWQKIDQSRLKNRTRDEFVAWVIMGLLVGGLLGNI